tara:strand:- start:1077 stop:2159 length:1083 start_codon:yes stop_codon:yes gene_type:complete
MENILKKKKIVFIESNFYKSGPNNQLQYILTNLKNFSYKILILSSHDNRITLKNKHVLNLPQGLVAFFFFKKISNFLRSVNYDIIHINSSFRALLIISVLSKNKNNILYVLRNDPLKVWDDNYPPFLSKILSKIYLNLLKKVNIVFCSKSLYLKYNHYFENKNYVIQNSIKVNKENKEKKINKHEIKFFTLSRLIKTKNISFLIKTFKNNNFFSNHKLYIIGDGNEKNNIIKMCEGVKNIFIEGYSNNVHKVFDEKDVLLSSSTTEGLPNSVLEALSNNIPCILSDIDQHNEIYEGVDILKNLIFKNNESIELIRCVKYLIDNENEVRANMKRVIKNFSVEKMVTSYEDFYNKLCSNQNY